MIFTELDQQEFIEYYSNHSNKETMERFGIGSGTVSAIKNKHSN
jgi:hypothetical protein